MGVTATTRSLTNNRQMRELLEEAEELGFTAEKTSGNHIRLTHPDVPEPLFAPSTPSDWRGIVNARSLIRRSLRQAQEEKEKTSNPRLAVVDNPRLIACGICRGRGTRRMFLNINALNEHVRDDHPAQPCHPSIASRPTEDEKTMTESATNVVDIDMRGKRVGVDELIEWLDAYLGEPGSSISRQRLISEFPDREVTSAVEILRQRGKAKRTHLSRLISTGSGIYMWAPGGWNPVTVVPTEEIFEDDSAEEEDEPEEVIPPSESRGSIFEVVNKFVDGQLLVRDEEGNLFSASLQAL